jgi:hypothetical protein
VHLRFALLIPLVLPVSPMVLRAQDAQAARDDAEWLEKCRERDAGDDERACEVLVETVPQAAAPIVVEASKNGAVEVRGWDRSGIEVHARIDAHAETMAEATQLARRVRLELAPDRIRAVGVDDRRGGVSYEILVPRRSGLEVATINGPLKVEGLESSMNLSTQNGPLGLIDLGGDVTARAMNGPLKVVLSGDRWRGAGLDAETVNGPVSLEVQEGYSAELEIGTHNGPFASDLPFTLESGELFPDRMRVRLGEGGAPVRVVTSNGPVKIRRR